MSSPYDTDFHYVAYVKTTKFLYIIFIILIVLCNGALIFGIWSQKQFFYSAKYLLLVSLSIGDIFLALYSLVISTRAFFQDFSSDEATCSLWITAVVYERYLLNFVHGTGLALLSAEYIHRCRSNSQRTKSPIYILRGLAISCIPWILGLVIILPLSMAGMDFDTCRSMFNTSWLQAVCIVSTIVPAVIAVVLAVIVACVRQDQVQVFSNQSSQWNTQTTTVIDGYNNHPETIPLNTYPPQATLQNNYPSQTAPLYNHPPATDPQCDYQSQTTLPHNYPPNTASPPIYPQHYSLLCNTEPPPYSASPMSVVSSTHVENVIIGPNSSLQKANTPADINHEKYKILSLAILFFLLVLPQAIFYLAEALYSDNNNALAIPFETYIAIHDCLMWLMYLRSIITPLIAI